MNDLILFEHPQGSPEWHEARKGIPTATGIDNIVTPSGKKSSGYVSYLAQLVAESIEGIEEIPMTPAMQRGLDLEPNARLAYEFFTGYNVQQVGGVFLNEERNLMISPDGLIPELKKGVEIKCPLLKNHIKYIIESTLPTAYIMQVQSALWVTGYQSWDFVSYCPEYQQQTLWVLTVEKDEKIFNALDTYVPEFLRDLKALKER